MKWKGNMIGILEMRRHYANYLKGLPNIKPIKQKLVTATSIDEINAALANLEQQLLFSTSTSEENISSPYNFA
jgi:tRNA-dihydrouridine synthase